MIDIESKVYTAVATAVRASFSKADISGVYVKSPSSFPHVSLWEADNYSSNVDTGDEKYATVMYEVNVYSNKTGKSKSECRSIMKIIDGVMYGLNFTRIAMTPVPNLDNATIYRLTARYRAETNGTTLFRR